MTGLSFKQTQAITELAFGASAAKAAATVGVHPNTIAIWLRTPAFQAALARACRRRQAWAGPLVAPAMAYLRTVLRDPKTPVSIRIKAASAILAYTRQSFFSHNNAQSPSPRQRAPAAFDDEILRRR